MGSFYGRDVPSPTPPCPCHPRRGHVGFGRQRLGARPERAAWRPPLRPRNTPTKVITFGVSGCQRRGRRSSLQRSSRRREPNVEEDQCESRSAGQEGGTESPRSLRITPAASSTSHGAATDDGQVGDTRRCRASPAASKRGASEIVNHDEARNPARTMRPATSYRSHRRWLYHEGRSGQHVRAQRLLSGRPPRARARNVVTSTTNENSFEERFER